jgi:hypothetical protein
MTDPTRVVDAGDLRLYRTEIPNLIDDMNLSVYAFRLYVHLKRVAGASNEGACWQSTRTLATHCGMSASKVSESKQELVDAGLIEIEPGDWRVAHGIWVIEPGAVRDTAKVLRPKPSIGFSAQYVDLVIALGERDGWDCHYCGSPLRFEGVSSEGKYLQVDHKQARAAGGTNERSNLVLSCQTCNNRKGARYSYEEFLRLTNGAGGAL